MAIKRVSSLFYSRPHLLGLTTVLPSRVLSHLLTSHHYNNSVPSRDRYLAQCKPGFEARLTDVIVSLAPAAAPNPSKMLADAAKSAQASGGGGKADAATKISARERAQAAREGREGGHAERTLCEFVKDMTGKFLADSFGIPSFARVLRVFLRTGFLPAAR